MSNFLKNVIKETGNEYRTIAIDGLSTADVSGYVDTGRYIFKDFGVSTNFIYMGR